VPIRGKRKDGNAPECRAGNSPGATTTRSNPEGPRRAAQRHHWGEIQHWEHGRNNPGLARLLAIQQICPRGREWTQLNALIWETQARVSSLGMGAPTGRVQEARKTPCSPGAPVVSSSDEADLLQLRQQVAKLCAVLQKRNEQLRILQDRTVDLYREIIALRASHSDGPTKETSN